MYTLKDFEEFHAWALSVKHQATVLSTKRHEPDDPWQRAHTTRYKAANGVEFIVTTYADGYESVWSDRSDLEHWFIKMWAYARTKYGDTDCVKMDHTTDPIGVKIWYFTCDNDYCDWALVEEIVYE